MGIAIRLEWLGTVIIILILLSLASPFFISLTPVSSCIESGDTAFDGSDPMRTGVCCEGLVEISAPSDFENMERRASVNSFKSDDAVSHSVRECVFRNTRETICSNCGNNICERWETECNCAEDRS